MKNRNFFTIWNKNEVYEIQPKDKQINAEKLRNVLKVFRYTNLEERALLILSVLAAIGNGIIPILISWILLVNVLDVFIEFETPGNPHNVTAADMRILITDTGYSFFVFGAINFVTGFIQIWASETVSRKIMAKIKTEYLAKMLNIEIGSYDKSHEQFVSTVSQDLKKMTYLLDSKMVSFIEILSFFLSGVVASLPASWKVTLLINGLIVPGVAITYFMIQLSKKKGGLQLKYGEKCTKIASEVLGNVRTVTAYGGENKEIQRFKDTLKLANKYGLKQTTVISIMKALNYFLMCLIYALAYYISIKLYILDDFDPGWMFLIVTQAMIILQSVYMLSTISDLFMATDSICRVMEFLNSKTSYTKSIEKGVIPNTFEASVSFRNVQFSYPTKLHTKVLHDLTLEIEFGKITAVVGTSGAGKSSIVNIISRLYDITAGQVLIGGVDIKEFNISWLRNQIGIVGQEPLLFDTSIEENIRYGKTTASLEEIIEAAKISYAHDFIEKLPSGYGSVVGEGGTKLSGGQKQRIAIARAIVRKPKFLLLDEATSALDTYSEGIVQKALDNAMDGRTTLIIAHRMSTVKKADIIYAMKNGCVVEKGTHSELMNLKGYYYSLVKVEELEKKETAFNFNPVSAFQEDLKKDESVIDDNNLEVLKIDKKIKINKENLKLIVILLLAGFFSVSIAAFITSFYFIISLFCESYTHAKDELNGIAVYNSNIMLILGVTGFFAAALSCILSTMVTRLWLEKMQNKAFSKIVSMDISWFDRSGNSPSECLEVMTNCPPLIESVTGDRGAQVIIFIFSLLFAYGYAFFITIDVTLINVPILIFFFIINSLRIKKKGSEIRSAALATRSSKVAIEYVKNVKTIQLLNCQKYVINQYQDLLTLSNKEAFVNIIWYSVVFGINKALTRFSLGVTYLFGTKIIENQEVPGTLFIRNVMIACILSSLSPNIIWSFLSTFEYKEYIIYNRIYIRTSNIKKKLLCTEHSSRIVVNNICYATMTAEPTLVLMSQYSQAWQALKRLSRVASMKTYFNKLTDQGDTPEISGNVVFKDVTFSYPTRKEVVVLNNLNLRIEAGTTVALVGDSGSGKSTIISLLERFYHPNSGNILFDGNDINKINVRYLRSQMGLVLQEPSLFDMTIKENIIYGLEKEVEMEKIIEAAKIANIHYFIIKLPQAYDTPVGERGSKLSGGEKQRIAIARAVLRNPKILLLDEFTSALDTESEKTVQEALEKASVGKTTIVIAHRLSTIRKADKIVVLHSGGVVEEGNHQQLLEKKGYYFHMLNR